ncbi:MAG: serine hydrolase domain-containing protein [Allosphingosinicella sp.]|uniref:serine hydrolase domain-containing protein n=1 Tax=Allosphingosinicella sp. TaxID=2823234 RepID=UPI003921775B
MVRRPRLMLLAALAALLSGCSTAQRVASHSPEIVPLDAEEQRFAADFRSFMDQALARLGSVPGVSVAIARSDGPIFIHGFGMADIERGVPMTPNTRVYIASSTKSFVGLAFAVLERRGAIDLDWTLAELAPDVAFDPSIRADAVTLRHLLSHTHGLDSDGMEFRLAYSGEHDPATLWRLVGRMRANGEAPLGTFDYGNLGYNLATLLIERRLGRRWQDIVRDEVLRPLGMTQTHPDGLADLRRTQPFASPYGLGASGPERVNLLKIDSNMQSAGGLFSSANDLSRWLTLQLAAHRGDRRLAIPADLVTMTHRPIGTMSQSFGRYTRAGYGLGWYSGALEGEMLYHSFGGYAGARSHVSFMPLRDLGVAIVTNDEGAGYMLVDIAAAYAYRWFQAGPEVARREADERVEQLATQAQRRRQAIAEDRARRAGRPWRLSLSPSAYSGRYCNEDYGTLTITSNDSRMAVRMGAIDTVAAPFTEADSIRLELIPGEGRPYQFEIENGRPVRLRTQDRVFERCG